MICDCLKVKSFHYYLQCIRLVVMFFLKEGTTSFYPLWILSNKCDIIQDDVSEE